MSYVDPSVNIGTTNIDRQFEKSSKAAVVERKIRVNWLPEDSAQASESKGPNDSVSYSETSKLCASSNHVNSKVMEEEPPAYTSPGGNFETPAPGATKRSAADQASPIPPPDFTEKSIKSESSPQPIEPASALSDVKTGITSAIPSSDELRTQLADANAHIQRLKDRLADQGLRQRKTGTEAKAAPAMLQQTHTQAESGVPLQIVAGLCLLSFLIAYFFF